MKPKSTRQATKMARKMTFFDLLIILGVIVGLAWFYNHSVDRIQAIQGKSVADSSRAMKLGKVTFFSDDNRRNTDVIVEIAESDYEQQQGLMFRQSLPDGQGMLFIYPDEQVRSFWMKNTPVSLDMIFINSRYEIVKIRKYTHPNSEKTYSSEKPAQYVVEVVAGYCDTYGIREGQRIFWERIN